nr:MAG TPA: hypothetical protein [Crassvirales sp.]
MWINKIMIQVHPNNKFVLCKRFPLISINYYDRTTDNIRG